MVNFILLIGCAALGGYFLWHGIYQGIIQREFPGGWEFPDGWSGGDAVFLGVWISLLGMTALSFAAGFGIHIVQGGGSTIEWTAAPIWFIGMPGMGFYLLSGVAASVFGWRSKSIRWAMVGGISIILGATGFFLFFRTWYG